MPRAKPSKAETIWTAKPHRLKTDTRKELRGFLKLDGEEHDEIAKKALDKVENWLGFFSGADEATKGLPNASQHRVAIESIAKASKKLAKKLSGLHPYTKEELGLPLDEYDAIEASLGAMVEAAENSLDSLASKDGRGRPREDALTYLVRRLRKIFWTYRPRKERSERMSVGSVEARAEWENDEIEFVKFALADAGVDAPERIAQVFSNVGAGGQNERAEDYEKIVKQARKRRANEHQASRNKE